MLLFVKVVLTTSGPASSGKNMKQSIKPIKLLICVKEKRIIRNVFVGHKNIKDTHHLKLESFNMVSNSGQTKHPLGIPYPPI